MSFDGEFRVRAGSGTTDVSVMYITNGLPNGIANANAAPHLGEGFWWLARLVLKDGRGKGVGTEMMRLLKIELVKDPDFEALLVAPGGYGSDEKRQWDFYVKNGFEPYKEALLWLRPKG